MYVYAYIYIRGSLNKFPDFLRMGSFIDSTHMKLPFEGISSGCNALDVPFQQLLMLNSCKMVEKQSEAFHMFLWNFFQV